MTIPRSGSREIGERPEFAQRKEHHNLVENAMIVNLTVFLARRSRVGLTFACILVLSATPARAIKMAKIAELNEHLGGNYPCGCANHTTGRNGIYGTTPSFRESLVVYEYEGNNQFQRVTTGPTLRSGPWAFGDGNNDGKMEVLAEGGFGYARVVLWEAPSQNSFPSESVWSACPVPGGQFCCMNYVDFWQDGHQEVAVPACDTGGHYGIWLYKNSGDNCYPLAAVLVSDSSFGWTGDFDVGDFDRDSLTDLVTGNGSGRLKVFEAAGNDSYVLAAVCTTGTDDNWNVAAASDMDHDGWPKFIAVGMDSGSENMAVVVCEASGYHRYHQVWEQVRPDFNSGDYGNPISVGDIDGDGTDAFAVSGAGSVVLFKCTGPHEYSEVWRRESTGTYLRLFDINQDGRAEVLFDGPQGTEIWEDTEGLGVAEFSKFSLQSPVKVSPSVVRLGASLLLSGVPPDAAIDVLSLDGRLVSRASGVRQSTWSWDLRNQSGNLVPAGTYFAVIRSKGKSTSLKLCLVK
jgi:hypothetical protein